MTGIQSAFGFMRSSKLSYPYMGMVGDYSPFGGGGASSTSRGIHGGTTIDNMTSLSTQPTSTLVRHIALAVDGSFIAQAMGWYSIDGGASWTQWAYNDMDTDSFRPGGINGSLAYNPTAKRAMGWSKDYSKWGPYFNFNSVNSLGVVKNSITPGGEGNGPMNVIYSPALNAFYLMHSTGSNTCNQADGTTGTAGFSGGIGVNDRYTPGISHNGYPLSVISGQLREYTSTDLSTYNQFGTISGDTPGDNARTSPFFYAPVNGKYYLARGSGPAVNIFTSTTSSPQSFSLIGNFAPSSASGIYNMNFIEQSNGTLWIFGQKVVPYKSWSVQSPYTYKSTDGGVTWTVKSGTQFGALAKNYTP